VRVLKSSSFGLTGRTQKLQSPITGKLAIYHETYHIQVTTHASAPPDLDALKENINSDLLNRGIDGFCEQIWAIQGVFQDTYKPKVWIAEEQPTLVEKKGLFPWSAVIVAIAIIAAAIAATVIVYILANSFMTISQWFLQPPSYVGGSDPNNPQVYDNWAEYLSAQHLYYWYVCPKCGAGFGAKAQYPNITDVPEEEVNAYKEHVESCLGIPTGPQNVTEYLIYAGLIVGGVIVVVWLLTSTGKKVTEVVYAPSPPPPSP
jgi:hypothetical protein